MRQRPVKRQVSRLLFMAEDVLATLCRIWRGSMETRDGLGEGIAGFGMSGLGVLVHGTWVASHGNGCWRDGQTVRSDQITEIFEMWIALDKLYEDRYVTEAVRGQRCIDLFGWCRSTCSLSLHFSRELVGSWRRLRLLGR